MADDSPARPTARPSPGRRVPLFRLGDVLLPRLQPEAARRLAQVPPTGTYDRLARARHHLLVTLRKDGSSVPVTVWAAAGDGRFYVRTERTSGKVKRLRRNPDALLAPATARGRPLGPAMAVTGRVLPPEEEPRAETTLARAHGWYRAFFENSADRLRVDMCYLELQPRAEQGGPAGG